MLDPAQHPEIALRIGAVLLVIVDDLECLARARAAGFQVRKFWLYLGDLRARGFGVVVSGAVSF